MSMDFALEMAWKSTVLALAILTLLIMMRRHDPSHRAAVGSLGLTALLVLPILALTLAVLPVPSIDLPAPTASIAVMPLAMDQGAIMFPLAASEPVPSRAPALSVESTLAAIWAAGALFVLLRLIAGLATLRRWTASAEPISSPVWNRVKRKCGVPDNTSLLVSDHASAPLSWGWRVPVILIDRDTLAQPDQAEAIIAHEAAHLQRLDWPRLIAARLVVALFWFNPLVWLVERFHLQDVEEAADAAATGIIEPSHYAQTLLDVARGRTAPVGANCMAAGALSKRIKRVLSGRAPSRWERIWRTGAMAGVAIVAGPITVTQIVAPAVSAAAAPASLSAPLLAASPKLRGSTLMSGSAIAAPVQLAMSGEPKTRITLPAAAGAVQSAWTGVSDSSAIDQDAYEAVEDAEQARLDEAQARRDAAQARRDEAQAQRDAEQARRDLAVATAQAQRDAAQAQRDAEQARRDTAFAVSNAKQAAAQARVEVAAAMRDMRKDLLSGADDMDRGVVQMRKGAAEMRDEARKLRNPAYRAEQIRKAIARGYDHVPTDQELIDAIPKMEEGARKMDAGVEKMREGAARMRRQARGG